MGNSRSTEYFKCKENKLNEARDARDKHKTEYSIYKQFKNELRQLDDDRKTKCRGK